MMIVIVVGRNGVAGPIDKGAGPNGLKWRGLRPHLSIIQISKSDWSEGPITFRVGHVKDKFNTATSYI